MLIYQNGMLRAYRLHVPGCDGLQQDGQCAKMCVLTGEPASNVGEDLRQAARKVRGIRRQKWGVADSLTSEGSTGTQADARNIVAVRKVILPAGKCCTPDWL